MISKRDADALAVSRGAVWEARSPSGLSVLYFDSDKREVGEYISTRMEIIWVSDPQVMPDEFFRGLTGLSHLDTGGAG
jgi:hypothetical protein